MKGLTQEELYRLATSDNSLPVKKQSPAVSDIAKEFVDRMEQHKEELRWDNTTFRLLFKLITALRDEGLDAAEWWRN